MTGSGVFVFVCVSRVGEETAHHQQQQHTMSGARWAARLATFTVAQYEELEQHALIYKYLVAGVPVPPDLRLPIHRGFDSLASHFYQASTFSYLGRVFLL